MAGRNCKQLSDGTRSLFSAGRLVEVCNVWLIAHGRLLDCIQFYLPTVFRLNRNHIPVKTIKVIIEKINFILRSFKNSRLAP